jgi:ribose 5-phosphate isomerase B
MKIFIGCDHAAFEEKQEVLNWLRESHEVEDLGCPSAERCNYPDFGSACAKAIQADQSARGILICGSGIGMSMVANRYKGVRAALIRNEEEAKLSRGHNDANVLCLGARLTPVEELKKIISVWLEAPFEEGRHTDRIALFNNLGE